MAICLQQLRPGLAAKHRRQLPRQVVNVVNSAVQSQAAGGRVTMRGVPRQKNASGLELVRKHALHRPTADVVDLR